MRLSTEVEQRAIERLEAEARRLAGSDQNPKDKVLTLQGWIARHSSRMVNLKRYREQAKTPERAALLDRLIAIRERAVDHFRAVAKSLEGRLIS